MPVDQGNPRRWGRGNKKGRWWRRGRQSEEDGERTTETKRRRDICKYRKETHGKKNGKETRREKEGGTGLHVEWRIVLCVYSLHSFGLLASIQPTCTAHVLCAGCWGGFKSA